jgi:hypothetical protein
VDLTGTQIDVCEYSPEGFPLAIFCENEWKIDGEGMELGDRRYV